MDTDDEKDLADRMQRIDHLNIHQRRIIGGVVAMLQAFDDDAARAVGSNCRSPQSSRK